MKRSPTSQQLVSQELQEPQELTETPNQTVEAESWAVNFAEEEMVRETTIQPRAKEMSLREQVLRRNASKYEYPSNEGNSR